jgi:hypothetical protein
MSLPQIQMIEWDAGSVSGTSAHRYIRILERILRYLRLNCG